MSRGPRRVVASELPPVFIVASSPLEVQRWARKRMLPRSRVVPVVSMDDLGKARGVSDAKAVILGPVADAASAAEAAYVPLLLTLKFGASRVSYEDGRPW